MAYDFRKAGWFRALSNALLAIDSWIDSAFYTLGVESAELWRDFSSFMERFHARGATRVAADLACGALTLGASAGSSSSPWPSPLSASPARATG